MTDYELAYLFLETVNTINEIIVNFSGMLFAFLVASALAAQRMSRGLVGVSLFLFSVIQFVLILQTKRSFESFSGLALRIKEEALVAGMDLQWHAVLNSPAFVFEWVPTLATVVLLVCYAAAIYFFFLCRRGGFSLGTNSDLLPAR